MKNYYEILEVNPKASIEVIEKAYKVLIKKYRPDSYEGENKKYAEERSRDINEAYKILSDQFLKTQYDKELQKEGEEERLKNYNNERMVYENSSKHMNNQKEKMTRKEKREDSEEKQEEVTEIGSMKSLFFLLKTLFKNKPNIKELKKPEKEDMIAAGLTLLIVLIIGVILWFIPATNGWIRSWIPFN